MLIAVTSEAPSLDARIDQRFGRCPFFLIINTDDLTFETIPNQSTSQAGGAGIQAAQMIAGKGVTHVFTGACGPNAYQVLGSAGIKVVTGCSGTVHDAIRQCREGRFVTAPGPNVADHYGVGQTFSGRAPAGFVPGMGRGMGMGGGRGRGRGMGRGINAAMDSNDGQLTVETTPQKNAGQELELLKKQMQQIKARIEELEQGRSGGNRG
jgi:predicted Fe-Mo cluster-binding NifX family protein